MCSFLRINRSINLNKTKQLYVIFWISDEVLTVNGFVNSSTRQGNNSNFYQKG